MIDLDRVSKAYAKGQPAVDEISLHIDKGEFVFIVGDSGSGKSTLIKLLLKELEPTEGVITVNNHVLNTLRRSKIAKYRRGIGIVFQDFRLLPDRNVYENVAFTLRVCEYPNRIIKKKVPEMLRLVGLAEKYKSLPRQLSGGEQQRVAIARALAKNPQLLLCDEPTGALDYNTGKAILSLLQKMSRENNMTVIIITHNSALTAMADRVVQVKNGTVVSETFNSAPIPVEDLEW